MIFKQKYSFSTLSAFCRGSSSEALVEANSSVWTSILGRQVPRGNVSTFVSTLRRAMKRMPHKD
jgi:hypothetical protein